MVQLITDRSQYHVDLLKRLSQKSWDDMTAYEQKVWYDDAAKGAYNYTDLNRVESTVVELAESMGLTLTTKTDWSLWDIPVESDMERYLGNVVFVRDTVLTMNSTVEFPTLPDSMSALTLEGANNIEKVLEIAYRYAIGDTRGELGKGVLGKMVLGKEL